jgi:hypothetical protein
MKVETFEFKLAGMRKPERWIVYPRNGGRGMLKVQGDRSIASIDPETGKGVLNWRGSNAKYGPHLSQALGAEPFTFPQEFVNLARNYEPSSGDSMGGGSVLLA